MAYLYHVSVAPGLTYDCIGDEALGIKRGDDVIVKCERYQDFGLVTACSDESPVDIAELDRRRTQQSRGRQVEGHRTPEIIRVAREEDHNRMIENAEKSQSMQQKARERIAAHNLDMKLIDAHCSFDRRLAVFLFSAEGRVDFRELLRDLSHQFRTRVELRQVGVRDEAAVQGGIGSCGRAFCCATFLRRFNSINVKMAKMQGLSLNPANISGACGRLKCCLQYEAELYRETYEEARAKAKSERARGSRSEGDGRGERIAPCRRNDASVPAERPESDASASRGDGDGPDPGPRGTADERDGRAPSAERGVGDVGPGETRHDGQSRGRRRRRPRRSDEPTDSGPRQGDAEKGDPNQT